MNELAIWTRGLTKIYESGTAVDRLDWEVPVGSAYALLGPNGAGKSTTLRMLLGLVPPSNGECLVLGEDPWHTSAATRARIGYVSERRSLPPWVRVGRLIRFHAELYPRWNRRREQELRDLLSIPERHRVGELSKGQQRSLAILLALSSMPDLLVLDEPTAGLDVAARRDFLALLADYLAQGERTLVLSSHLLTDVERIASHVAILNRGTLVESASLDELKEHLVQVRAPAEIATRLVQRIPAASLLGRQDAGRSALLTVRLPAARIEALLEDLPRMEVDVHGLPLEEIYLVLTRAPGAVA
jgi:ABC-2 type transport system ATP-binding protein